jgi:hypothetical protein
MVRVFPLKIPDLHVNLQSQRRRHLPISSSPFSAASPLPESPADHQTHKAGVAVAPEIFTPITIRPPLSEKSFCAPQCRPDIRRRPRSAG